MVLVGGLSPEERARVLVPTLQGSSTVAVEHPLWGPGGFDLRGEQSVFNVGAKLRNLSTQERKVAAAIHLTREFETEFRPQPLSLAPSGTGEISAVVMNATALPGSTYPITWVLQWDDNGLRGSLQVYGMAEVDMANRFGVFAGIAAVVVLVLGGALWWVLYGGEEKSKAKQQLAT
jgi:hypothetical protein